MEMTMEMAKAGLKEQLANLAKVEGINSVVVVSRDGFVIEGISSKETIDTEAVGAIMSAGMGSSETMGFELNVGQITQVMNEYKFGVIIASFLDEATFLVIVADLKANLGNVRYQLKKQTPGIVAAL
jgi:predicted regulator of Ras-like GTPase activity (Roadblock/LC7/MglB family)